MNLLTLATKILAQAAATLPIIALLSLLAGRRGNAAFCVAGTIWLIRLGLSLALAGPIWLICGYLQAALPYTRDVSALLAPLLKSAGLPWSLSLLAWFCGWLVLFGVLSLVKFFSGSYRGDSYPCKAARGPLIMLLAAAACYFCPFVFINWPFAGLPEGLAWERAAMAIFRHANSEYFRGFCAAGAIALSLWPLWRRHIPGHYIPVATRWLAFWAFAGNLPWLFGSLGPALGASFNNANLAAAYGINRQLLLLALFGGAALIWAFLLWRPLLLARLAWPALALFACASLAPAFIL